MLLCININQVHNFASSMFIKMIDNVQNLIFHWFSKIYGLVSLEHMEDFYKMLQKIENNSTWTTFNSMWLFFQQKQLFINIHEIHCGWLIQELLVSNLIQPSFSFGECNDQNLIYISQTFVLGQNVYQNMTK